MEAERLFGKAWVCGGYTAQAASRARCSSPPSEASRSWLVRDKGSRLRAELYEGLRASAPQLEVHRVGDAVAPRRLYDALLEGTRVGHQV